MINVNQVIAVMGMLNSVTVALGANSPINGQASSGNASITNGQINLANENTYEVAVFAASLGLNAAAACVGYNATNTALGVARKPWFVSKPLVRAQQLLAGVNNLGVTDNSPGNGNCPYFANGTAITQNTLQQLAPGARLLTNIVTNKNNNYQQMIQQVLATAGQQSQQGGNGGGSGTANNKAKDAKNKAKDAENKAEAERQRIASKKKNQK